MREAPIRRSKTSGKLILPKATASEILAGMQVTKAELEYVRRVLATVEERASRKRKRKGAAVEETIRKSKTNGVSATKEAIRKPKSKVQPSAKRRNGR
jgi:hypothetical protein